MSATDTSAIETKVDNQIESLRRRCDLALQRRLSNPDCLSPAALIRILSPVIEKYLTAGLVLEEVAKALQEEGFSVTKGHLVRHLGTIRAENGLPPIKRGKKAQHEDDVGNAPAARVEGGQRDAQQPVTTVQAPVPATVGVSPAHASPAQEGRPRWMSEEMWAIKPKIDKILNTFPTPDREYPELAEKRFWTDSTGKKWDVRGPEKPANDGDRKSLDVAAIQHGHAWRDLMEKWGVVNIMPDTTLKPRYTIAEQYRRPLTVDLDELITKHLS